MDRERHRRTRDSRLLCVFFQKNPPPLFGRKSVLSNSANRASDLPESFMPSTALIFRNADRPRMMVPLSEVDELFDALCVMPRR